MDETNINRQCMERILQRLTGLICMLEYNDIELMEKLTNIATSISTQLISIDELELSVDYDEEDYDDEEID